MPGFDGTGPRGDPDLPGADAVIVFHSASGHFFTVSPNKTRAAGIRLQRVRNARAFRHRLAQFDVITRQGLNGDAA